MSASTDALNKAIDDLGTVAHTMLDKIAEEAQTINSAQATGDGDAVNSATARITSMTQQLKDQLGALSNASAAHAEGAGTDATIQAPTVANEVAPTPLAGVPVTPASTASNTAAVVPNTDFVVTETSPNQDTSGPSVPPGAEAAPGTDAGLAASTGADTPADVSTTQSPAVAPEQPTPVAGEPAPVVTPGADASTGASATDASTPASDADVSTTSKSSRSSKNS